MAGEDNDTGLRANALYWESDLSVNQIAEELDLSKGTLYGLIRPLAAGLACPDCSEEVVFANRTAREGDEVACPGCGWEGEGEDAIGLGGDGGVTLPEGDRPKSPEGPPSRPGLDPRTRTVVGGALLGAAAGLALLVWTRRR